MNKVVKIGQLRGTIFIPENLGFNPSMAETLKQLLMPTGQIQGLASIMAPQPMFVPISNMPLGMPWVIQTQEGDIANMIMFMPGKIDIVRNCDVTYGNEDEQNFIIQCEAFIKAITSQFKTKLSRIAYAPTFVIDQSDSQNLWDNILHIKSLDGLPIVDRNISFLLKKEISLNDRNIQINLLHTISDGMQTKVSNGQQINRKVSLVQLDINTVPEVNYQFEDADISPFFSEALDIKNKLVNNLF